MKSYQNLTAYPVKLTFQQVLELVRGFSLEDKITLEKELEKFTLKARSKKLDSSVKKNNVTMDEIVEEVKKARRK